MTGASTANEQDSGLVCAHKAHMISVYKDNDGWIESTEVAEDTWIHVEAPTESDLKWLGQETAVPDSFLRAALDPREVARTHSYQDSQLVIVRVPYDFGRDVRIPIRTVPLAMIVSAGHFITICRRPIDFVRDLNYAYDEGELKTHRGGRMILGVGAGWQKRAKIPVRKPPGAAPFAKSRSESSAYLARSVSPSPGHST